MACSIIKNYQQQTNEPTENESSNKNGIGAKAE